MRVCELLRVLQRASVTGVTSYQQRGGDVAGWLPLLSQTQVAIGAIEAAMRESLTPGYGLSPD